MVDGRLPAGEHVLLWKPAALSEAALARGVYHLSLTTPGGSASKSFIWMADWFGRGSACRRRRLHHRRHQLDRAAGE